MSGSLAPRTRANLASFAGRQSAHQRRGAAAGGQLRQAAGFAKAVEVTGTGLKNAHLTFAHNAFVRFIYAFNTILKLTVALRHFFDDGIRASRNVAVVRFDKHDLAYTKFVGSHGEPSQ